MSPKNKGKFGKGKPAVEAEDEFVSTMGKLGAQLKPHVKKIIIATTVVTVALVAIVTYRWWQAQKEAKATALYTKALMISKVFVMPEPPSDEEGEAGDTAAKTEPIPKDEDGDGIPDSFSSEAQRAKAALVPLEKLRSKYGSTDTAKEARLLHASMLYDLEEYARARDMYRSYLSSGSVRELRVIAREGMGYAQEALAYTIEDAEARNAELRSKVLETFRAIQRAEDGPDRDRAVYHEARILASLGQRQEAIAALEQALETWPESKFSYDMKQRLVQLQAEQK